MTERHATRPACVGPSALRRAQDAETSADALYQQAVTAARLGYDSDAASILRRHADALDAARALRS